MTTTEATRSSTRLRLTSYWMVGLSLCLCYAFLRDSDWKSTSEFHTIVEAIATLLALTVGAMALVRFYAKKNVTTQVPRQP